MEMINITLKHCALGVLLAFVFGFGAYYIFDHEMRLNTLYKEVQKRTEEVSLMKQINNDLKTIVSDLKTKVDELEKQTIDSTKSIQKEISHMKEFIEEEQKRKTEQLTDNPSLTGIGVGSEVAIIVIVIVIVAIVCFVRRKKSSGNGYEQSPAARDDNNLTYGNGVSNPSDDSNIYSSIDESQLAEYEEPIREAYLNPIS